MDWVTELDRWAADYLPDVKITAEEPMARFPIPTKIKQSCN